MGGGGGQEYSMTACTYVQECMYSVCACIDDIH